MSRLLRADAQQGAAGGLNLTGDPSRMSANQLQTATNVRLLADGGWAKRLGTRRLHASAIGSGAIVRGGFAWRKPASQELLALSNGALHVGSYGLPMTWTAKAGSFSASAVPSFVQFRDGSAEVAYIADGGLLNKYDGSAVTADIASTGGPAVLAVYGQRLLAISGTNQTVMWSALNNGDTLNQSGSGGGSSVVRTFGDQRLTALAAVGSSLLMFHVTGISRFTGMTSDDIAIDTGARGVSGSEGTVAPKSIQVVELDGGDVAFFLTSRGLFAASEGGVMPVSREIEGVLAAMDQSSWARVQSAHAKQQGELRFYLPDVGVYSWNYRTKSWSGPDTGVFVSPVTHALWNALDSQSREVVLVGGADGFVRQSDYPGAALDDILSDGTGGDRFAMRAKMHRMFGGDRTSRKSWRRAFVTCNLRGADASTLRWTTRTSAGQFTFASSGAASPAWGEASTEWGTTGPWGGVDSKPGTYPVRVEGRSEWIDLEIVDDSEATPEYSEVLVEGDDLNRRTS